MTSRSAALRIADMLRACAEARLVVERGRAEFDADVLLRRAAERTIEMLVTAGRSIRAELESLDPGYAWQEMFGMRNRVAHEYWRTDPDLVWTALVRDVPEVEERLDHIRTATERSGVTRLRRIDTTSRTR